MKREKLLKIVTAAITKVSSEGLAPETIVDEIMQNNAADGAYLFYGEAVGGKYSRTFCLVAWWPNKIVVKAYKSIPYYPYYTAIKEAGYMETDVTNVLIQCDKHDLIPKYRRWKDKYERSRLQHLALPQNLLIADVEKLRDNWAIVMCTPPDFPIGSYSYWLCTKYKAWRVKWPDISPVEVLTEHGYTKEEAKMLLSGTLTQEEAEALDIMRALRG